MVGGRVAQRIEEAAAAVRVAPALGVHAAAVFAAVQIVGPDLGGNVGGAPGGGGWRPARRRRTRARDARRSRGSRSAAWGCSQCATAAAAASSMRSPSRKRSSVKGALIGCGSSWALGQANTWAEPGGALKRSVPQPAFTYRP